MRHSKSPAQYEHMLTPVQRTCWYCGNAMQIVYYRHRTVMTLTGSYLLTLPIRRCCTTTCPHYHHSYRPEAEGQWALPHGEYGLDVIALIGAWRFREHRSVPEIHQLLLTRDLRIAERTVLNLLHRYEELVAVHLNDSTRLTALLQQQGQVILAVDGLQPDKGHEVLWVVRECLSGEILLARPLLSSTQGDLVAVLREVQAAIPVPVVAILSDGQESIREAVAFVFPQVPHQLCQFHYLRDAALPIFEADRHAKAELKHHVRGIRPIERALETCADAQAEAIRDYCLAVRSALTDDGRPPLEAAGLKLHARLTLICQIGKIEHRLVAKKCYWNRQMRLSQISGRERFSWPRTRSDKRGLSQIDDSIQRVAEKRGPCCPRCANSNES